MSDPRKILQAIAKQARRGSSAAPKVEDIYHPPGSSEREENLARFLSGSRIRDDAGDPLRLYHITKGDFNEFIPGGSIHPGDWESGPAMWLSPYPDKQPAAHQVGGYRGDDGERVFRSGTNVMPVHAAIKNPLIIDDATSYDWARKVFADDSAEFPQLLSPQTRARLLEDGYDGIVYAGPSTTRSAEAFYGSNAIGSHPAREEEIISLLPNTLKSATGNRGTFDPTLPDITKAEGGPVNTPTEGEGGLYAAPNSTFDTPPPYEWGYRPGGAHADGGPVEMAGGGFFKRLARSVVGKPDTVKLPDVGNVPAQPLAELEDISQRFAARHGNQYPIESYSPLDEERARRIAQEYDSMQHNPFDPATKRSYEALVDETMDQYRALKDTGVDFSFLKPGEADPYARNPGLGYLDLIENGRLKMFPTSDGFGTLNETSNNPLLKRVGRVGDLENATANDAFRIVHDMLGHYGPGNPFFRSKGEERAWQAHGRAYSPDALPAATSELRGQNSWVNYGPHGETNRTASGADTIYADQKTGIMPPWTWLEKAHGGPVEMATGGTAPTNTGGQYTPYEPEGPGFFRNQDNYDNSSAGGINFIKNLVQSLSPAEREAQRLVSEATRKTGKEALVFGRGENPDDLAKLVHGTYDSVTIPDNYKQYAGQSTDPFFSLHSHPTNTLSPSLADLRIWGTRYPGTLGLPYQSMLINASPQDSLLRIGSPGKYMTSEAASRVDDVLNLKNKNEDLVANHGFMDPRMREFWKGNKLPDLAHLLHAESDQMPGVKSYLDKKEPGAAQGVTMRDLYAGNFLQRIAEAGVPVDVSAEHKIAGTPYLARDVWPEFAAHVQKYALPKADGGPVEMKVGGADKIKDAVGFLRRSIMPHARAESMVPPDRDIESRYWHHKKPPDLDTITADYGVNHLPVDVPTMKIEDIKGGRLFAIPHDRSATDLLLGGYNGNTFANPVTSPGGPLYAFGRNPEAVTASGEKVIKNLHESALRAADEGKTPYLAPWLMGPHGVDFSTHMNEAVVQSLPFLKVPTEKKKELDALLSGVFKDFPGIDHKDLAQYLHSMVGTTRRDLPKLLDTGAMVNVGLDVGGLRAALTEPSLLHAPYGSSGAAISRIDPSMSPTMFGYPHHPSYPWQLRGTPVGGLDPLVPSQILYPDIYRTLPPDTQLGPKGRPVNNRRAFEMKSMLGDVYQDVNDEVINGVNEYQEYMRKLRGWKEGGTVEDEYHPIWQQSFAGGGQPEEPRGYYTLKEKYANKRRENAERLAQEDVEIKKDLGGHYRDMATQIPRGMASVLEIPGLIGDALNLRADYLDSVAPGSSPMRVPHWGTSEGISKGIDSLFPETTSRYGGETGRALGEMSLNALGLGAANKARGLMQGLGNSANLAFTLLGGPGGDMEPTEQQPPSEPSYAYEQFLRSQDPTYKAFEAKRPFYGMAQGGHAKDTGNTFDFLGPFGAGLNLIADGAGAVFNGEDFELDKALGYLGEIGGSLVAPGVGGALGRGAGTGLAHLIEPGEGDVGRDALNAGYGALRGGMGMFMAHGGSTGRPFGEEDTQDNLTPFLSPMVNPSVQPDPMDWAAANGVPGAIAPPLNRGNDQRARDAAERQRLMQTSEMASQKALQPSGGGGGGGGMGDIMGMAKMAMQIAPMFLAEGGSIPNQYGEQPWMYGDGALMARGGYLRGCGGMNG